MDMDNMEQKLQKINDIVIRIDERVATIPQMQEDIKSLTAQYLLMQGDLAAYTNIKQELDTLGTEMKEELKYANDKIGKLSQKIYWMSGLSAAIGFFASKIFPL